MDDIQINQTKQNTMQNPTGVVIVRSYESNQKEVSTTIVPMTTSTVLSTKQK